MQGSCKNLTIFEKISKNGYLTYITAALKILKNDFRNVGKKFELYLTVEQLDQLHLYKTIELICQSNMKDAVEDDVWFNLKEDYLDKYTKEFNMLRADYDLNEDGEIEDDEKAENVTGQVFFQR